MGQLWRRVHWKNARDPRSLVRALRRPAPAYAGEPAYSHRGPAPRRADVAVLAPLRMARPLRRGAACPAAACERVFEFAAFALIANVAGVPVMSSFAWAAQVLPVGVQVVARASGEPLLFRLAAQVETAELRSGIGSQVESELRVRTYAGRPACALRSAKRLRLQASREPVRAHCDAAELTRPVERPEIPRDTSHAIPAGSGLASGVP